MPADAGASHIWALQEDVSDDFDYSAPPGNKGPQFYSKWDDWYHNHWGGPGLTEWDRGHVWVEDGKLQFRASRVPGSDKVHLGCVSSKHRVKWPVYIEARAKVPNSVLACAVWTLSPDDTQEIDLLEAWGGSYSENADKDQSWFAERVHVSHHVFIRKPFTDYQPKDDSTYAVSPPGELWRDDFHRYGVYWRDPWHLEYYIDGELVRTTSGKDVIDPHDFTNGTGIDQEADIIIDMEDHDWRSAQGITPTDAELSREQDHNFQVDWIRVYKPVPEDETAEALSSA
ncbi:MAG: family 16 glycosylhydrolase [Planctomycetota bacterium]